MKLAFISNFLNHHQLYLCLEFIKHVGTENFCFIATKQIEPERVQMGYKDMNVEYPFVLRAYENEKSKQKAIDITSNFDVVIVGDSPFDYYHSRLKSNKLTFKFAERIFKNGTWHRFIPTTSRKIFQGYTKWRNSNLYMLCASAYLADDLALCGFHRSKCLKWGYFPRVDNYNESLFQRKLENSKLEILWVGRMIWWKHPEDAVYTINYLLKNGINAHLTIIGNGPKRKLVEKLIVSYNITEHVTVKDFVPEKEVRSVMEQSNIYIFSSGREEGWGVVLNEAMNSGCAVIAREQAGATKFLIKNNFSGLIYDGKNSSLIKCLDKIIRKKIPYTTTLGRNAYNTIKETWNVETAAKSFIDIVNGYFSNNTMMSKDKGPCSLN